MRFRIVNKTAIRTLALLLCATSCMNDKDLYQGEDDLDGNLLDYATYIYPFNNEAQNVTAEVIIKTDQPIDEGMIKAEIPHLKYNKSLLFMLTQDDCKHAAYSCTWAAINGKPLSKKYNYDAAHFYNTDLPPDAYYIGKTLGSTDGSGNEVRFHFTTTLAPEWEWMDAESSVKKGYTKDYYRFFMKSGLVWDNVKEIINYGNGIAFHDANTEDVHNPATILNHYGIAQDIILKKLDGRGCKMLAEPNGNRTYIDAAQTYAPIQVMTAQANATKKIQPFQVKEDFKKVAIEREFRDDADEVKQLIEAEQERNKEDRDAVYMGVHGTDESWANMLLWLNDTYGKDGDDSVWMPSQEEYYEYNYYRIHGTTQLEVLDENTLKLTVSLPSELYFYYPSVTVNINGISFEQVNSVSSPDETVTGLSYGAHEGDIMLNIDCRKHLHAHATHFVERYEDNKTNKSLKADALYFANMLKDSPEKTELLERVK